MIKKWLSYLLPCAAVPLAILLGVTVFRDRQYTWITLCVAVFSCVPFFLAFEKGKAGTKQMILIALMISLGVVSRILFAPLPGFKPVTAIIVITALYFGPQAGFMTGALTAVISNFYFGQGPWTPFQMFVWGLIGLLAGVLSGALRKNKVFLSLYGIFSGLIFSLFMDVWTVLWWDGTFQLARYIAALVSALPFILTYAVSNVIFLLLLMKPIGGILERIKTKYGL